MLDDALVIVLAGGVGERLYPLTRERAKPAVYFGGPYRIIDFTLSNCINSGLRHIFIATQYKSLSLNRHIRMGWNVVSEELGEFVEILPPQKRVGEHWYLGTADAVYQNLYSIMGENPRYLIVLSGDHVYKMDYARLLEEHVARAADATVVCVEVPLADARGFGVLEVDAAGRVVGFEEKPAEPQPLPGAPGRALASMGVYVFNAPFLYEQLVRDADDRSSSHDFGADVIPYIIGRYRVHAHRFAESCVEMPNGEPYWRDVGTLDAYWEANLELAKVTPQLNLYDRDWPVWTYQEQLPPAKFVFDEDGRRGQALDSLVSSGAIVSGGSVRRSVISPGVFVHAHATVENSVILNDTEIGRHAVVRNAILDNVAPTPQQWITVAVWGIVFLVAGFLFFLRRETEYGRG